MILIPLLQRKTNTINTIITQFIFTITFGKVLYENTFLSPTRRLSESTCRPTLYAVTIDGGQIVTVPETDSSPWDINDVLIVGDLSNGTLKINDNGMVNAIAGYIGYSAGATGIVDISGAEARWNNTGNLTVGRYGDGSLTINEGGVASSAGGYIGSQTGATGAVDVSGAGSLWNNSANLFVGQFSNGTLTISEAGVVNNTHGYIGYGDQSTGVVNVSGAGSQWNNSDTLSVGQFGNGTLTVSEGGWLIIETAPSAT